jgi:hypothetical protein
LPKYILISLYFSISIWRRDSKNRKANWVGHIMLRNCLLKHVIEGKVEGRVEVTGRQWRRRKQPRGNLEEKRGYWK